MEDFNGFIKDLKELIAIKSVKAEPKDNMPFGEGVYNALIKTLEIGKRMGFDVVNYDNYLGEIAVGTGEGIGIIGHIDVVPEGDGWKTDPYALTETEGGFYGRGVTDDKGPLLLALYALKKVAQEGKLNKRIRLFIGCDEESGWADIKHFNKEHKFPKYGFSPDGNFPVCYAEKGPNKILFEVPFKSNYKNFTAGQAVNAVPAYALIYGEITDEEAKTFGLKKTGSKIESFGKAAHGAYPELGKNAILPILKFLDYKGEPVKDIIDYLFKDVLGITGIMDDTGYATMSPNVIRQDGDKLLITVDFRVPATMRLEKFIPYFDKTGLKYTAIKSRDPHYVKKDDVFVETLLNAYNKVMNLNEEAVAQCGGTFASVFEMGVAFGPEFLGEDTHIHEPGEVMSKTSLNNIYNIYYTAIKELTK